MFEMMHWGSGRDYITHCDRSLFSKNLLLLLLLVTNLRKGISDGLSHVVSISHSIEAVPGDRVAFECTTSTKADKFDWTHNGSLLQNITGVRLSNEKLTVKVSSALIHSPKQTGEYQCIAWFGPNAIMSVPATLRIATISNFSERPNVTVEVPEGNTAIIRCDPPYSNPLPSIQFYKRGFKIDNDKLKYQIMPSGVLQIYKVGKNDEDSYTCSAKNDMTGELRVARHVVNLKLISKTKPVPLYFVVKPLQQYEVENGSNLTMECVVNGSPAPRTFWSKYGGSIDSKKHIIDSENLILTNIGPSDEGTYICYTNNSIGDYVKQVSQVSLLEKPNALLSISNSKVEEFGTVTFECLATGKPKPDMYWVFNGQKLENSTHVHVTDNVLVINNVTKNHAGAYQCFAVSGIGASSGTELLYVVPLPVSTWTNPPNTKMNKPMLHKTKLFKGKKKNHRKKMRKKYEKTKVEMIPPSKPNVTRLSDDSVMITWDAGQNQTGSPIQFFKVQYKEAKKGAKWETVDDNIPCHITSHAVMGLLPNRSYRFRIAAVYSNEDNKVSENSAKFTLSKVPTSHRPSAVPRILSLLAISQNALELQWEIDDDIVPIEGFIVYYRMTTSAGEYIKRTVWGSSDRSYVIFQLKPSTAYEVKMTSFNEAGTSGYSAIVSTITQESKVSKVLLDDRLDEHFHNVELKPSKNQLYMVVGGVVGGLILLLLTCCILYRLKCKHQPLTTDRHSQEKFLDIAQKINLEQKTFTFKSNGCISNGVSSDLVNITPNPLSDIDVNKNLAVTETAFSSSSNRDRSYHKLVSTFRPYSPTPPRHYSQDSLDWESRRRLPNHPRKNYSYSLTRNSLPPGDWGPHNMNSLKQNRKSRELQVSMSKPELFFPQQTSV